MTDAFGDLLREWRSIRRFSQLDLSLQAETSSRHLSFLESGRAKPSRAMVLKLTEALQMPKAVANQALYTAGFAPAFPQLADNSADLAPIREAVDRILTNHAPLPAFAIDRRWNVVAANAPASLLFERAGLKGTGNMVDAIVLLAETGIIENWTETSLLALSRMRAEIIHSGGDAELEAIAKRLADCPRLAGADFSAVNLNQAVIPTVLRVDGRRLSLFSTIAHFSTVQDVASSELRIEMMFPADAATARWFAQRPV
jgi:transcriptional regulator with XRE-family HTH domain